MRELLRSNDIVFLSWAEAMLKSENIGIFALDVHMSVLEGSAGAIQRRVMVAGGDYERAKCLLEGAGEGDRVV